MFRLLCDPEGIDENYQFAQQLTFPNPAEESIYINLPVFTSKIEVYNIKGEMVQQLTPQKEVAEINVKDLPKGVYVVKMYSSKGLVTTRFVKE